MRYEIRKKENPPKQELFKNVKRIKSEFKILICSFALNLPPRLLLAHHSSEWQKAEEGKSFFHLQLCVSSCSVVSSQRGGAKNGEERDKMNLSIFNINSK